MKKCDMIDDKNLDGIEFNKIRRKGLIEKWKNQNTRH